MGNRRRVGGILREVKALTLVRTTAEVDDPDITADASVLISGLSSLLHVGIHFAFFPLEAARPPDLDFAGNTFAIYGWTADERGQRVQLDSEPVSGVTPLQAPGGWAGRTELDQLELRATVNAIGVAGEWRVILVLEPADGAMCEGPFDALAEQIVLGPVKRPVVIESP